jgi:hypothetical protein
MRSLKLDESGDIIFSSLGKLSMVTDMELLIQSFQLKFKTKKGELFYNDEYGFEKIKGKITKEILLDALNDTFLQDERILEIEIINFNIINTGEISTDIFIKLNTNEILDFNIII